VDAAGRAAQGRLRALAERTGLRIIGPNCQGFAHLPSRLVATFASPFLEPGLATGGIAMVSQSGAMAGMIYEMARAAGLGLNYWVSTGNEADVQAAEILAEVVEDEETRVACCYLEDVKDAGLLREALARAHRRGVPVFVLKSGRTAAGDARPRRTLARSPARTRSTTRCSPTGARSAARIRPSCWPCRRPSCATRKPGGASPSSPTRAGSA